MTTARPIAGEFDQSGRFDRRGASPELYPLPSKSLAKAPFEPLNISDSFRDVIALAFVFVFLGTTAVACAVAFFLIFFVSF